jgi:E3 ubiquitin-protein ligase UBR2
MSDDESIEIENRLARTNQPRGFPTVAQVVGVWQEKFENGELNDTHFKEHWRLYVPRVLSLDPNTNCLENVFDEENVENILFAPLEEFICGGNPNEVFERIKRLDDPPSVCGRVYKLGEPTYNCRECGTDPTCVLCVDCFKKSEHRNHKYKMSTSNGGGCCDCGDVEAWKKYPYCSIHIVGTQESANKASQFPEDMRERTRITFSAILKYAFQLLSIDHEPKLPIDLRLKEVEDDQFNMLTEDVYCTVLYNDETHTFDHVINTLTKVIKCSQKDAIDYVTNIDREGRAVVKCATFQYCTELKSEVERFTGRSTATPLKVQVKHSHVVAHQLYALKLLSWLQKILSFSKTFREIFALVVLETKQKQSTDISILEGIITIIFEGLYEDSVNFLRWGISTLT